MNAQDIFELQQAGAEQEYLLNRALEALEQGKPFWTLETEELDALRGYLKIELRKRHTKSREPSIGYF